MAKIFSSNSRPLRLVACLSLAGVASPAAAPDIAWSRSWKPDATALARDYSIISDTRDKHDIKMVFWITPGMMPAGAAKQILDQYIFVGVARGHVAATGTISFDTIDTLQATDAGSKPLRLLRGDDVPPAVAGAVSTFSSAFGQSLGAFGKGFQWFVFQGDTVHACGDGGLSIPFADEVYTYRTPIPGCSGTD